MLERGVGAGGGPRAPAVIAFVFPGQGAQYVGMGVDLADRYDVARRVFAEASQAIGLDVLALCRDGPPARLRETENTQPAILTCCWAVASVLAEAGVRPDMAAGLSLGEYAALVAAGALAFGDAVTVVRQRGRFMQEAAGDRQTAMAAVLGLEADRVIEVCEQTPGFVEAVNFNAPGQVVIAGDAGPVADATARLKAAGARRVIPLAVSAPFHTSLMRPAADRLASVLAGTAVRPARLPVVANVSGQPVEAPEAIRSSLISQVAAPVRWEQSVRTLRQLGASVFVEAGPGTTLAGLIRKTVPDAEVISVENQASLEAALARLPKVSVSGGRPG
ncbi:MAG: ACP S-malonyltransferase [Armatimonadota bacterium]|nr:ACP S-malonyltransferase [Armatimonadota bacterium]